MAYIVALKASNRQTVAAVRERVARLAVAAGNISISLLVVQDQGDRLIRIAHVSGILVAREDYELGDNVEMLAEVEAVIRRGRTQGALAVGVTSGKQPAGCAICDLAAKQNNVRTRLTDCLDGMKRNLQPAFLVSEAQETANRESLERLLSAAVDAGWVTPDGEVSRINNPRAVPIRRLVNDWITPQHRSNIAIAIAAVEDAAGWLVQDIATEPVAARRQKRVTALKANIKRYADGLPSSKRILTYALATVFDKVFPDEAARRAAFLASPARVAVMWSGETAPFRNVLRGLLVDDAVGPERSGAGAEADDYAERDVFDGANADAAAWLAQPIVCQTARQVEDALQKGARLAALVLDGVREDEAYDIARSHGVETILLSPADRRLVDFELPSSVSAELIFAD